MNRKILCLLLFVSLFVSTQAEAVKVGGKNIGSIPDILRAANAGGFASKGTDLEIPRDSILRISRSGSKEFAYDLTYGIGSSNKTESLGSEKYGGSAMRDDAFCAAAAKTTFGGKKIVVASTPPSYAIYGGIYTNWRFGVSFIEVGRNDDGNLYQSEFGYWKYPDTKGSGDSAYNKDIKTGIFVEGFDGELVISAAMETTNDNPNVAVKYSDKSVKVRFDFWALYTKDGEVQYRKIDEITKLSGYLETAPLYGLVNATDDEWSSRNNLNSTTASPYMVVKVEPLDLDGDGYTNEIAMLTAYVKGIDLDFYRISYADGKFSISQLDGISGRQYTYSNPDYVRKWSYNGWNRMPGADIAAGDYDGDGRQDLALFYYSDIPAGERRGAFLGANGWDLHGRLYTFTNGISHTDSTLYNHRSNDDEVKLHVGGIKAVAINRTGSKRNVPYVIYGYQRAD